MIGRVKGFRHSVSLSSTYPIKHIYILVVMITKRTFSPRSFLSQCCQKKKLLEKQLLTLSQFVGAVAVCYVNNSKNGDWLQSKPSHFSHYETMAI